MSIHKSLVSAGKLRRHRNVLTRDERLEILKKEERWKEGQSIFNLPKVRSIMMRAKKKVKEEAAAGAEAAAPGAEAAAATPAAAAGTKAAAPAAAGAKAAAPAAGAKGGAAPKKEEKKK